MNFHWEDIILILYHFYDSFHMSFFFFVSGLFLFKKFDANVRVMNCLSQSGLRR